MLLPRPAPPPKQAPRPPVPLPLRLSVPRFPQFRPFPLFRVLTASPPFLLSRLFLLPLLRLWRLRSPLILRREPVAEADDQGGRDQPDRHAHSMTRSLR